MNIESLKLYQYRNYQNITFSFQENCIYCIYGKNAQGKTNLIESIYFLSHLHSFRTNVLDTLIQHDKDRMMIETKAFSKKNREDLKIVVSNQKKHLFRFQNPVKKYSDFVGIINAILFCPDDISLFHLSPKNRRHFVDMELIKLSKTYTSTLSHYQSLLKSRNIVLKSENVDENLLNVYTTQMIEDEKIIIRQRQKFIQELIQNAKEVYPFFSNGKEDIDAQYLTFVKDFSNLDKEIGKSYENSLLKDKMYKQTNVGIHRDDVLFLLNQKPIYEVASQGQKRSFLLALKLGLSKMIYDKTGEYPILLLDDVFSELDEFRKKELLNKLPLNMQIFITTTEKINPSWFKNRNVCFIKIENGVVKEVSR